MNSPGLAARTMACGDASEMSCLENQRRESVNDFVCPIFGRYHLGQMQGFTDECKFREEDMILLYTVDGQTSTPPGMYYEIM